MFHKGRPSLSLHPLLVCCVSRGACLDRPPQDQRSPAVRGVRLSRLPSITPATAWYDGRPALKSVPIAPNALMADPGDLVARALTILAEETAEWRARRAANFSAGGTG